MAEKKANSEIVQNPAITLHYTLVKPMFNTNPYDQFSTTSKFLKQTLTEDQVTAYSTRASQEVLGKQVEISFVARGQPWATGIYQVDYFFVGAEDEIPRGHFKMDIANIPNISAGEKITVNQ